MDNIICPENTYVTLVFLPYEAEIGDLLCVLAFELGLHLRLRGSFSFHRASPTQLHPLLLEVARVAYLQLDRGRSRSARLDLLALASPGRRIRGGGGSPMRRPSAAAEREGKTS